MRSLLDLLRRAALAAALAAAPGAASAQNPPGRDQTELRFREWIERTIRPEAEAAGVSRPTFERAVAGLALDWSLPELQPPGASAVPDESRQAEFRNPAEYFPESRLAALVAAGRGRMARWDAALDRISASSGVPREVAVAIWGRESHFGQVAASRPAIRVLATQAFMGRRRERYRPELLAALKMLEEDHILGVDLRSSWAGAMGQPQFLPTTFLRFAVDGDGDGRRDIWRSVPDSLASIAHFLAEQGWKKDLSWGFEVIVPTSVSCSLEGPRQGRAMAEWARLGLVRAGGSALPERGGGETQYLLMPAGRLGPAFLVTENFYVLKRYNESDLYALFVGHLADRLAGRAAGFEAAWRPIPALKRADLLDMQIVMQRHGYDIGRADGLVGFGTRTAIGQWQARLGLAETCMPDAGLARMR